eukprot:c13802_g1_i1.p1 GENE.c13802_g1_i1~~c13802_g1_i1.p1  ORF type:complete len:310 (-),score=33.34 c13802_g1_i1:56-985(-)
MQNNQQGWIANRLFSHVWRNEVIHRSAQNEAHRLGAIPLLAHFALPDHTPYTRNRAFNSLGTIVAFKNELVAKDELNDPDVINAITLALSDTELDNSVRERAAYLAKNLACNVPSPETVPVLYDQLLPAILTALTSPVSTSGTRGMCIMFVSNLAEYPLTIPLVVAAGVVPTLENVLLTADKNIDFYMPGDVAYATMALALCVSTDHLQSFMAQVNVHHFMQRVLYCLNCSIQGQPLQNTVFYPSLTSLSRGLIPLAKCRPCRSVLLGQGLFREMHQMVAVADSGQTRGIPHDKDCLANVLALLWIFSD